MELFLRSVQYLVKIMYIFVYAFLSVFFRRKKENPIPPITNRILTMSLIEVVTLIRAQKLTSEKLVRLYIERIDEVNPHINAVVENKYKEALRRAKQVDELIASAKRNPISLQHIWRRHPMLGVPFTVKESCGLHGASLSVGSLQRVGCTSPANGIGVELLCRAGAIPLLISATPEYCFSIETNTHVNGKCLNPYDARRTCGGSSGGEGALNGCGASLFGVGSDIAGSIRIPSLFCGIFGHKPTAGLVSVEGHFPNSTDPDFADYLQIGPMTRFARDLEFLTGILSGHNAQRLLMPQPVLLANIKIYYALGYDGLNGFLHSPVVSDMQNAIIKAVMYLHKQGHIIQRIHLNKLENSLEISLGAIAHLRDFPFLMSSPSTTTVGPCIKEYIKSLFGKSMYTKDGLLFELMRRSNAFMSRKNSLEYKDETAELKHQFIQLLGNDGVLIFPTFHVPAIHHHSSHLALWGIDYTLIFNVLGLPATHVPMGLGQDGLPVGFQVIAAPFCDTLCFKIAVALETGFGGWIPPTAHQIQCNTGVKNAK